MRTAGIRELKQNTTQLLRLVREQGERIEITYRGQPVALLVPVGDLKPKKGYDRAWADLDTIAADIGARWPKGVSAVDAVREGRR